MRNLVLFITLWGIAATGLAQPFALNAQPNPSGIDWPEGPIELSGVVRDATGEPISGASVFVDGTRFGALTGDQGEFRFMVELEDDKSYTLVVSMLDFKPKRIPLSPSSRTFEITMELEEIRVDETVISGTRVKESILRTPVTVEAMTLQEIEEAPSLNVYDAVGSLKGVDIIASSLTFKSINTRGFNAPANSRFVQRLDGVDMQTPGLNVPTGALNGANELDVYNVEIVPGAASALYGPNAFNGLMNVYTKDPWDFPGLSASVKMGMNHLNSPETGGPRPFADVAMRWAKPLGKRWAVKLNLSYIRGTDWYSTDSTDIADYSAADGQTPGPGGAGYDGLNLYGDEVSEVLDEDYFRGPDDDPEAPPLIYLINGYADSAQTFPRIVPTRIARTGYREQDLLTYDTYSAKSDLSVYYRINDAMRVSYTGRASSGKSVLQADNRVALNNFLYHSHKFELTGKRFFVRTYGVFENAGDSYDTRFMGININRAAKSDTNWIAQYSAAYFGILQAINSVPWFNEGAGVGLSDLPPQYDAEAARAFADGNNAAYTAAIQAAVEGLPTGTPVAVRRFADQMFDFAELMGGEARYEPGTPEFERARDQIRESKDWGNGGAKFVDRSRFYQTDAQYDFQDLIPYVDVIAGGHFRMFALESDNLVFADTAGPIRVPEFGAYVQASRHLFKKRWRILASTRVDKSKNFNVTVTPRVATTVTLGQYRQHNLRASYQTGFRTPDLRHQYVDIDLGAVQVIGSLNSFFEENGLITTINGEPNQPNNYSLESVRAFREDLFATGDTNLTLLRRTPTEQILPERIRTIEMGYRGYMTRRLLVDVNGFYSKVTNFIGFVDLVGPHRLHNGTAQEEITVEDIIADSLQRFRRYLNSEQPVYTYGAEVGATYFLSKRFLVNTNYTYITLEQELEEDENGIGTEFNTPPHKVNVTFTGREILKNKNLGFSINYRWIDDFLFEYAFGTGPIPAYHLVDAQISYKLPKYKTVVRVGGTNLLNDRHIEIYGGPTIGSMVYVQLTYDQLFNNN